jgi:hypothetical protein
MTSSVPQAKRVELLVSTLRTERHARRALLADLVDELAASPSQFMAARAARSLQRALDAEPLEEDLYEKRIVRIGDLARRGATST